MEYSSAGVMLGRINSLDELLRHSTDPFLLVRSGDVDSTIRSGSGRWSV